MEKISISKFKATCFAVLERIRLTRAPILVTRRGVPVAEIKSPPETHGGSWIGSMAGTIVDATLIAASPSTKNREHRRETSGILA